MPHRNLGTYFKKARGFFPLCKGMLIALLVLAVIFLLTERMFWQMFTKAGALCCARRAAEVAYHEGELYLITVSDKILGIETSEIPQEVELRPWVDQHALPSFPGSLFLKPFKVEMETFVSSFNERMHTLINENSIPNGPNPITLQ